MQDKQFDAIMEQLMNVTEQMNLFKQCFNAFRED